MEYKLESNTFSLVLNPNIYYSDIKFPENTILKITLKSSGFCAQTSMDIDIKEFKIFISEIENLYNTLKGSAEIIESYGKRHIKFSADRTGHIYVTGILSSNGSDGYFQTLEFENSFDQTYLKSFVYSLKELSI